MNHQSIGSAGIALVVMLGFASSAHGAAVSQADPPKVLDIIKWHKTALTYHLNPAGSEDVQDGSDLATIHASFQDWAKLPCSTLSVSHVGSTTATATTLTGAPMNQQNDITWVEDSWPFSSLTLGVTQPMSKLSTGEIVEADIAFNGFHHPWSTVNASHQLLHVKSIGIHEVGHWYGLNHNFKADPNAWNAPTMVPTYTGSTAQESLEVQDTNTYCFLYSAGQMQCSSEDQCPWIMGYDQNKEETLTGKFSCQGGVCVVGGSGTSPPPPENNTNTSGGKCAGHCGDFLGDKALCQCDPNCKQYNDCCSDYDQVCGGSTPPGPTGPSGNALECGPLIDCLVVASNQQAVNNCYESATQDAISKYQVLDQCLNGAGCYSVQTQAAWEQCVNGTCASAYTGCVGSSPSTNSCAGSCGQFMGATAICQCDDLCSQYGDCCADYASVCGGTGPGVPPDNSGGALGCGEYFTCFGSCFDTACMDGCGASLSPSASAPVNDLFTCMQNNGCGNPGPQANEACASQFCSFQFVNCYGFAPNPSKGSVGGGAGGGGGCQSATAPGGMLGILLLLGALAGSRRRLFR